MTEERKYTITFSGRKIGAIGIFSQFVEEVTAANQEAARLKLYEKYDHILVHAIRFEDEQSPEKT
jgi:hypothetical protein